MKVRSRRRLEAADDGEKGDKGTGASINHHQEEDVAVPHQEELDFHQEDNFYKEDWVIQGARRLGCAVEFDPLSCFWIFTYQGELLAKMTAETIQTCGGLVLDHLRDTIDYLD